MNARILLLLLWPFAVSAQGFAGLGTGTDGFSTPQQPAIFDFPADHGPHDDYRIEWWYLTANLTAEDGTPYGLQWTLFRSALTPDGGEGWSSPQLWMGHAAVTTPDAHFVTERLARGGIGQAGVTADPFEAWIDDWQLVGDDFDTLRMTASGPDFAYDMGLRAQGPLVFHGDAGYSVKSAQGQASYYYSQPFYDIEGTLTLPDGDVVVSGQAWLDREWSSQPLSDNQTGWDWFSLSFEDAKLMGFQLRQTDGTAYTSATWIDADGTTTPYTDGAFSAQPLSVSSVAGREIPTLWRVLLPDRDLDVIVQAINDQAWMDTSIPYWEGPVTVTGTHAGVGYLEMTGYE
ncbi:iron ABC transporter permease [Octadecabacter sp. G9-8]|uniref:Iron ABC transporter permease n=1 Tax=Octadecabacter dasysiphoniae TaxID=2909341 RepID=A0ABS9D013_9RHOB|nr:lipocalin-like domain-containing protein [Octadecabacter dasysiphoniae]MCF2871653.1 iron ABC transporter permease [Octadecabacter dasysiphoniae]